MIQKPYAQEKKNRNPQSIAQIIKRNQKVSNGKQSSHDYTFLYTVLLIYKHVPHELSVVHISLL